MTGSLAPSDPRTGQSQPSGWLTAPVAVALVLMVTTFLHVPLAASLPKKTFSLLIVALAVVTTLWLDRTPDRLRSIGAVEIAMVLYLMWSVYSMLAPHEYPAVEPLTGAANSVPRFIMTGTVIPFLMYVVGRYTFDRTAAVRAALWTLLTLSGYSAAVSIMQFTGPAELVWPRFIVDQSSAPCMGATQNCAAEKAEWANRAVGVANQPVVNGLILATGLAVATLLASMRSEPTWRRWLAGIIGIACGPAIFLTHTRAAWLSAAVVLIIGALLARGYRTGFIAALGAGAAFVAVNWSTFTSSDREAGGVGSPNEVQDRLNMIQTALWATEHKPLTGWGIGRFVAVNTYHHQVWSPEIPFIRGYGIAPHENELGILAELGLVGLTLWVLVLILISHRLWKTYRSLPDGELCGKPLAVTGLMVLAAEFCTGLTVDLRFFDYPTATVFLLAGIAVGWGDRRALAESLPTRALTEAIPQRNG